MGEERERSLLDDLVAFEGVSGQSEAVSTTLPKPLPSKVDWVTAGESP